MDAGKLIVVALAAALACGLACAGPSPRIVSVEVAPVADGYRAIAVVENCGGGQGEVAVTINLTDGRGARFERAEKLDLDGNERKIVALHFDVPRADYRASARVEYPVR